MKLAGLEASELLMRDVVRTEQGCSDVRAAVESRMWRAAGIEMDLSGPSLSIGDEVFAEPHALGWLHQYLGELERRRAFEAHTRHEAKHDSQIISTQLFTPRWIADWLVTEGAAGLGSEFTVLDPACGGGQMLLAAVDYMVARGVEPAVAFGRVRGVDLDPEAVEVCRTGLKVHAARLIGVRDAGLEAMIDRNIVAGDGLFDAIERAEMVITNPPYMGSRSMPQALKKRLATEFEGYHQDLYLAFVARCVRLARRTAGILAQQTLWYLKRFEQARRQLLAEGGLSAVVHLGHDVFEALQGEKATVMAWVWKPDHEGPTRFYDLRQHRSPRAKRDALVAGEPTIRETSAFEAIPSAPLAFWMPPVFISAFTDGPRLADFAEVPGGQNKTGRNARFVRRVEEVEAHEIRRADFLHPAGARDAQWVYYSKGGRYAPWWGNWDFVVDWSDEARAFYASNRTSNLLDERFWFREGLCYSDFGGKRFNARWMPRGCLFDMAGPAIFVEGDDSETLAALLVVLNSEESRQILNALNPSLHYQVRDVRNLPIPFWSDRVVDELAPLGTELVRLARAGERAALAELEVEASRKVASYWS